MTQEIQVPLRITNQLFTEIRKDPSQKGRYYLDSDAIGVILDFPEPTNDDFAEWEQVDYESLPEEVKKRWFLALAEAGKDTSDYCIYSLEVSCNGDCWYLHRWPLFEERMQHAAFHERGVKNGDILNKIGESLIFDRFQPSPPPEIRRECNIVWQGYKMPSRNLLEALITAYRLGKVHQGRRIQEILTER